MAYAADVTVGVSDDRPGDVIGGTTDNNTVTIGAEGGGDHPVIGGNVAGGTSANASGNTVTINSIKLSRSDGTIYGGTATGTASNNTVIFKGGSATSLIGGATTGASGGATGNTVTVSGGNLSYVWGGLAQTAGAGSATGNTVTVNGGTFAAGGVVVGGGGLNNSVTGNMSNNTVTIAGGTMNSSSSSTQYYIMGGDSRTTSSTSNSNTVNLGAADGTFTGNITRAEVWGTGYNRQVQANTSDKIKGNTLNVNASNIHVRLVRNFEKYNFNLTKGVAAGSTMLTTHDGGFGSGGAVQWDNIRLNATGWNDDTTKYGRIGNVTLLQGSIGSDLNIAVSGSDAPTRTGTSGDFEYRMSTDVTGTVFFNQALANYVEANIDRFQNADATADNVTGTAVYGGYSSLGNTNTNNKIKITNTNNTNLNVYGGYTAGNGDSTNNHVTITGTGKVGGVYAGRAESSTGKAERNTITIEPGGWAENPIFGGYAKGGVKGNIVNIKGTVNATAYGGRLMGSGTAEANEVHLDGAMVKNQVIGAEGDDGALVKENRISVAKSLVKEDVIGGFSRGTTGKAEGNTVSVTGDSARVKGTVTGGHAAGDSAAIRNTISLAGGTFESNVYGGHGLQNGTVTGNTASVSGGVLEGHIYGGYSQQNGTVSGNQVVISGGTINQFVFGGGTQGTNTVEYNVVTIAGGTFAKDIYGAYSWHANGKTENNTVNLGDDTHTDLSGTTLSASNISGGNKAATGNTLNVNAKNIAAKSVNNFENYKFKLNSATAFGDTMLTVTDAGDFAGTGVDWSKLTVDRTALSDVSSLHGIQRITLLKRSNAADTLKFQNYEATENGTATETHEFGLVTDTDTDEANAALFEVSRFKGSEVAYNGTTKTYQGASGSEIYGGLSRYGHTTESNTLTVTGLRGTDDPQYAFGGINKGTTGDVKNNTLNIDLANAGDTIDEVYAGEAENANNTGEVSGNSANMKKGTVNKLYGGHTFGTGAVKDNIVNFSGGTATDYVAGAYVDNTANAADVTGNKVIFTGGTADVVEGGAGKGAGALKNNTVTFSGAASTADTLRGANSEGQGLVEENGVTIAAGTVAHAYGAVTDGTGIARKNYVTVSGGTVNTEIAGGVGYNVTANTVTISGGTVGGNVYGGKSSGPGSSTSGNVVNLGAADGTYTADLTNVALHGDNNSGTGATLNVRAKNITAKSADKFANYTFHLNDDIAQNGGSMLTLTENNGFNGGNLFDWTKLDVDTSRLSGNTVIGNATLLTGMTNGLRFSNYAGKDRTHGVVNGDYETALRTDTNTGTASKVILDYNRFQNNTNATYDGSTPATTLPDGTTEIYGGISYAGNTTTNNHLTVTGVQGDLTSAYGGKAAGAAGNATGNSVTITGTGSHALTNVYGGYVGDAANSGTATGNTVTLTGGKVTGKIYGGYTAGNGKTTGNTVNLGADPMTLRQGDASTLATGTNFTAAELYGGNKSDAADNTLNVTVKDVAAKKAQNFDKYTFYLTNSVAADKPSSGTVDDTYTTSRGTMLTLENGFDGQTADWNKVTVDTSKLSADKTLGAITLMRSGPTSKLKFSNYAVKNHAVSGDYEVVQRTDTNTDEANSVLIDVNRFRNGNVTYDGRSADTKTYSGVSYGGHTTENNTLTVTGLRDGINPTLISGGRTEGSAGSAVNNTVKIQSTAYHNPAGSVTEGSIGTVYGGFIGNAANGDATTGNTVEMSGGTVGTIHGGYTKGTGAVTGNTVTFSGGATLHELMGGFADNAGSAAAVTGNTVNLSGGSIGGTVYGGRTLGTGDAVTGNMLNVTNAVTAGQIANFEKLRFAVNKDTVGKTLLTLNGGAQTTGLDWQKLTAQVGTTDLPTKSYEATHVTLMANEQGIGFTNYDRAKELVADDVYEFSVDRASDGKSVYADGYRFKDNKTASYAASDGTHDSAWGGRSELGNTAEGNMLTVTGGTITDTAYGGTSRRGIARSNQLVMRGGTAQNLVGGFGASASDNTVDIFGGTIGGDVYGGRATNGAASGNTVNLFGAVNIGGTIHGGAGTSDSTNNTLAVRSFGTTAKDFDGVQNLHFYLPAGTTSSETRTMLTLTNAPAVKDISTLNLGVAAVAADARAFRRGDAVSLLKVNGMLTTVAELKNTGDAQTMKATQSGILDYTMRLEKRGENELIATVDRVDVNDRSKSPVETRVAASALLNAGADLLSHVGYTAAAEAAAVISAGTAPAPSSVEGVRNTNAGLAAAGTAASAGANASAAVSSAFQPWAAQGGSSVRLNSGSYVDAKGWNLNVGFARTNEMKAAKLTYGPFVEYGRGTYDSYLDDGTHGSGAMHYIGGGVMAKMAQDSGLYVEGSLRAGRVSSDYTGSDDAAELSYDNASTYFAGHVGVGQEWKLANGNKIEGYAKYFYSHQAGDTVKLRSGGILEFGDVDSHRLRVGARYTHAVGGGGELYTGLAYEHEFGGDATATYQGYSTPSPSLGGGTGILELGYRFAPKDGRVSYGVNLMGMTGQREGIAGGAQVTWAF